MVKNYSHLIEVDPLLVRSCLYTISLDDLMESVNSINPELLDILYVFLNKAPQDITSSNVTVNEKKLYLIVKPFGVVAN